MLYEKFKNEQEFRNSFIRPLLTKMGFLSVAELHGTQEFGKDFVFSEVTPFGFMRHYAVVAKHEKSITQPARICETVVSQIKQAFAVKFHLPESSSECNVSSVLVMNSGNITHNAEICIRGELNTEKYGHNVHLFSGEGLCQLDNSIAFNRQETLIPKLHGLKLTLQSNKFVWKSIKSDLPSFREARGCFVHALEQFLTQPFLLEHIDGNEIFILLQECRIIDSINSHYLFGVQPSDEIKEKNIDKLKIVLAKAEISADKIIKSIDNALLNFNPIFKDFNSG